MRKNISGGILLILLSVVILGSGLGIIPDIPWFKLICTAFFAVVVIKNLVRKEFFGCIKGAIPRTFAGGD